MGEDGGYEAQPLASRRGRVYIVLLLLLLSQQKLETKAPSGYSFFFFTSRGLWLLVIYIGVGVYFQEAAVEGKRSLAATEACRCGLVHGPPASCGSRENSP